MRYCVTSYGAQSKGVDCVFVAESSESFRAADRQQFYVSASRFKEGLTIYTDDKRQLLEAVSKSSERPSATDLIEKQLPEASGPAVTEKVRGKRTGDEVIASASKETEVQKPKTIAARTRHLIHNRTTASPSRSISI